jgi:hypothetical protein
MDKPNNVKKIREAKMLSKVELARMAGISPFNLGPHRERKTLQDGDEEKNPLGVGAEDQPKTTAFQAIAMAEFLKKLNFNFLGSFGQNDGLSVVVTAVGVQATTVRVDG